MLIYFQSGWGYDCKKLSSSIFWVKFNNLNPL